MSEDLLPIETAKAIVADNLALATLAMRYVRISCRKIEWDDQFQIACLGIVRGARQWNPDKAKFSTFAVTCAMNELRKERLRLSQLRYRGKTFSKDSALENSGWSPTDYRSSELAPLEHRDVWQNAMTFLDEREQLIIRRRFVDDATHQEISRELGVSRQRVAQIEAAALEWVRAAIVAWERQQESKRRVAAAMEAIGFVPDAPPPSPVAPQPTKGDL